MARYIHAPDRKKRLDRDDSCGYFMSMKKTQKKRSAKVPRPGRPPKAEEDRRGFMVRVLVTEEEAGVLKAAADKAGFSLSSWVRAVALATARQSRNSP